MVVGVAVVDLHVHASQSLKQKRGVVRSVSQRVRNKYNVSVSEVGGQGTWQRATLGIAAAGSSAAVVRKTLESVLAFVESLHLAEVLGAEVDVLDVPVESGRDDDPDAASEAIEELAAVFGNDEGEA